MRAQPTSVTITSGDCRATIATRGAGPSSLTLGGQDLLEGYEVTGSSAEAPFFANLVLAPWPNRTDQAAFEFDGERHQLELTEPSKNTALHGLVADRMWTVASGGEGTDTPDTVELELSVAEEPGWPWPFHLSVVYRVTDSGLQASFAMRNDVDAPMPAACGFHLYPSALGAATDDCTLMIPDHRVLPLDARGIPAGPEQEDTDVLPDRDNPLAGTLLDHCLHLVPTEQDPQFVLRGPDGAGVALTTCLELSWVQIFTPDASAGMPYPGRAGGRAVAVEPMTAPPDALNSGTDLSVLVPGESLRCSWRIDVIEEVTEQENG